MEAEEEVNLNQNSIKYVPFPLFPCIFYLFENFQEEVVIEVDQAAEVMIEVKAEVKVAYTSLEDKKESKVEVKTEVGIQI